MSFIHLTIKLYNKIFTLKNIFNFLISYLFCLGIQKYVPTYLLPLKLRGNHLQREKNLSKQQAVEEAAGIRLRPILMTTAAMVFGVTPLLLANGAGAVSRFQIGLVISSGLLIGTCFTLFVVPTLYTYLASDHRASKKQ